MYGLLEFCLEYKDFIILIYIWGLSWSLQQLEIHSLFFDMSIFSSLIQRGCIEIIDAFSRFEITRFKTFLKSCLKLDIMLIWWSLCSYIVFSYKPSCGLCILSLRSEIAILNFCYVSLITTTPPLCIPEILCVWDLSNSKLISTGKN